MVVPLKGLIGCNDHICVVLFIIGFGLTVPPEAPLLVKRGESVPRRGQLSNKLIPKSFPCPSKGSSPSFPPFLSGARRAPLFLIRGAPALRCVILRPPHFGPIAKIPAPNKRCPLMGQSAPFTVRQLIIFGYT